MPDSPPPATVEEVVAALEAAHSALVAASVRLAQRYGEDARQAKQLRGAATMIAVDWLPAMQLEAKPGAGPPVRRNRGADVVMLHPDGFKRGAVVHRAGSALNMLVVRSLGATTAVVVLEGNQDGALRLRELPTADLREIVASGI